MKNRDPFGLAKDLFEYGTFGASVGEKPTEAELHATYSDNFSRAQTGENDALHALSRVIPSIRSISFYLDETLSGAETIDAETLRDIRRRVNDLRTCAESAHVAFDHLRTMQGLSMFFEVASSVTTGSEK